MSVAEPPRAALAALLAAGIFGAATAYAEPADVTGVFDAAVASVRAGSSCPALQHDPTVQHAAEISNRSTDDYLNHTARYVPVSDPLEVLRDLGSDATRAVQLRGHGRSEADAIKGALLQGNSTIPDCSYTRFGTSVLTNPDSGHIIVVAVLAAF